ncbi:involucrin-like isoform X2 [Halichondria panicea]|uniref:involucrin-like isoform X2 n=1 Tax=Halichondria panicea TaxID=6063 RepID=UPI00312BB61E
MATGQYNIRFSDEQARNSSYNSSYPTARPNPNGNQYRNFSVPLSQDQYNHPFPGIQPSNYSCSYATASTSPSGNKPVYKNYSVPQCQGQQAPNQTTQGRWINEGLPSQGIPGTEPFLVQDNYLENNHTGEHSMYSEECRPDSVSHEIEGIDHEQQLKPGLPSQGIPWTEPFLEQDNYLENNHTGEHSMHSEECRPDSVSHEIEIEGIDHEQQLKPGDYKEREGHSDLPALQQDPTIFSLKLAIIVEPREMITKHRSYHNEICGKEAVKRLRVFGDHHYLTRFSENRKCYILSVCTSDEDLQFEKIKHFQLKLSDQGIKIQEKKQFEDLEEMLKYYETSRLDTAFPRIGDCLTEDDYRARVREIREQQVQQQQVQEQEQRQQQAQLRQKKRQQQEKRQQRQQHEEKQEQIMAQLLQTLQQQQKVNDKPKTECTII